jgi:hypothetical protein
MATHDDTPPAPARPLAPARRSFAVVSAMGMNDRRDLAAAAVITTLRPPLGAIHTGAATPNPDAT